MSLSYRYLLCHYSAYSVVDVNAYAVITVIMVAYYCGKKPNWPWKGSQSQWDQERSDQIRVGETICPGFEALNPVRFPIFDSQENKVKRSKWLSDKKKAGKPVVPKKVKNAEEYVDATGLDLADFM